LGISSRHKAGFLVDNPQMSLWRKKTFRTRCAAESDLEVVVLPQELRCVPTKLFLSVVQAQTSMVVAFPGISYAGVKSFDQPKKQK